MNIRLLLKQIYFLKRWRWLIKHPSAITSRLARQIYKTFDNLPVSMAAFAQKRQLEDIIVSFTSFPARMEFVEYTLFSLIKQTVRPQKIILWLSEEEFPEKDKQIPGSLKRYSPFGFEIRFVKENFRSYKKLIYALREYLENTIVTADDDVFYKSRWLELLYNTHRAFPQDIITHHAHRISCSNRTIDPYPKWGTDTKNTKDASHLNFQVGYGGVLYPPHTLYKDIDNQDIFLELCPYADDIWFYVMALLAKTKIRKTRNLYSHNMAFDYQFTEEWKNIPALCDINWGENQNDIQFKAALKYYNLYDTFYENYYLSESRIY